MENRIELDKETFKKINSLAIQNFKLKQKIQNYSEKLK